MTVFTRSRQPPSRSVRSFPSSIASREKDTGHAKSVHPLTTLTKRLLFPQLSPGAGLPPLLLSDSLPTEFHAEVYDFIALALRAFVNPWWTKITRYDKEFLVQINLILTDVARSLEARLSSTDLCPLIFRDIPTLISQHYEDYRTAALKFNTSYSIGGAASLPQLFHQFQPHMAITSNGRVNEDYIRQCVDFSLKACLPPKDYGSDTERYIIREIVLKVVLDAFPRLSQPWFLHKLALDFLGSSENEITSMKSPGTDVRHQPVSFHLVVIFILSTIQSVSGFCLTLIYGYKQVLQTIKQVNSTPSSSLSRQGISINSSSKAPAIHPYSDSELPSPSTSTAASSSVSLYVPPSPHVNARLPPLQIGYETQLTQPVVKLISTIFCLQTRFASAAMLNIFEIITAASSSYMNKLLPHVLYKHVLSPAHLIDVVKISKKALFPDGYLAPPVVDPTSEEQAEIRERLVNKIEEVIPWWLSPILLGPKTKRETINGILDPLSSSECNAHLILFLLDAILMTVVPELGELTDANLVKRYEVSGGSGLKKETEEKVDNTDVREGRIVSPETSPAGSGFSLNQS